MIDQVNLKFKGNLVKINLQLSWFRDVLTREFRGLLPLNNEYAALLKISHLFI